MELIIYFENKQIVELRLMRDGRNLDMLMVPIDIHFDTVLVTSIDKLLKRNRIDPLSLGGVSVTGQTDQSSVAYHIACSVAAAIKSLN